MVTVIEQATENIVSTDEVKNHLRILHNDEDEYISEIVAMSTEIIEKDIGKSILKKKYKYIVQPSIFVHSFCVTKVPISPLIMINSISKNLPSQQNEEIHDFKIEKRGEDDYIKFKSSLYPVEIIFEAGIAKHSQEVPSDLKYAVLQVAKSVYEGEDARVFSENQSIKSIINNYRSFSII
jgi:uncharacterized phiE125 gp8 family phage protein